MTDEHTQNLFILLDHLGELDPDDLLDHFTEENTTVLKAAAELLKEDMVLDRYLSEKMFVQIVSELVALKAMWSEKLETTLHNADEAFENDEKVRAMWILDGFIRFCPSPYYREIAEEMLDGYGEE